MDQCIEVPEQLTKEKVQFGLIYLKQKKDLGRGKPGRPRKSKKKSKKKKNKKQKRKEKKN